MLERSVVATGMLLAACLAGTVAVGRRCPPDAT
jgi:hypothetical protein